MHLWNPPFCGDMDMLIARDGTWWHEGKPIRRPAMVQLFASILMRDKDNQYYLVTPEEKVRIQVEDCPFVATLMDTAGSGKSQTVQFTTNTGETVIVDSDHALAVDTDANTGEPHPIVHVRSGLNALLTRALFYRLVDQAEQRITESEIITGIWSSNQFFELGRAPKEEG